jgi:hypothetical protein
LQSSEKEMRKLLGAVGVSALIVGAGIVALSGTAGAAACTGARVVVTAPYTCTKTKTIDGVTVHVTLVVNAEGRAVATYRLDRPQPGDVEIVMRSYRGVAADPVTASGKIPAGEVAGELVIGVIQCGQVDVKAIYTAPGDRRGNIAGPYVTWGNNCQPLPTSVPATSAPPTTAAVTTIPASVLPTSVVRPPTSAPATEWTEYGVLPTTGSNDASAVEWGVAAIVAGLGLVVAAQFRRPRAGR